MEVLGEFEAEGNCGICGARLRFKGSDIRGYSETHQTLPQYGEEPSSYEHPVHYITCGSCQQESVVPPYSSSFRVPQGVFDEVKLKRWDGHRNTAVYNPKELLHPRAI